MNVKKNTIIHYLLIYVLFIFQGSVVFKNYQDFVYVGIIIIFLFQMILKKKLPDKQFFLWVVLIMGLLLITHFTSAGSLSLLSIGNIICRYIFVYIVYNYNRREFCNRYIKFTVFMCVVSLVFYVLQIINPDIIRALLLTHEDNYHVYYGGFLYSMAPTHLIKNCGVFTEPGLYEIVLGAAIFILLYMEAKLTLSRKQKIRSLFIIIVTLITTQSTTGYITAIILFAVYFVHRRQGEMNKFRNILIVGLLIFIIVDLMRGESGFIYEGFIRKLINENGHLDVTVASGKARYYSALADLAIAKEYPLGMGYTRYLAVWRSYLIGQIWDQSSCVGLTASLAVIGIPATIVSLGMYVWQIRKNFSDWYMAIAYIFMFINISMGQPNIRFPALMILLLVECKENIIQENSYENPMVNQYRASSTGC